MGNVNDKDIDLDNLFERRAGSGKNSLEVLKDLTGMNLNIIGLNESAFGCQWDLARKIDKAISLNSLGVRANRLGGIFGKDLIIEMFKG